MNRFPRPLCATLSLAIVLTACGGDSVEQGGRKPPSPAFSTISPFPQSTEVLPKCRFPKEKRYPQWVPDDLPLPKGTFAYKNLAESGGYKRALFVLRKTTTQDLTKLVLEEWPKAGYTLGRGDAEPGEVEDDFHKPPAVGAFKANDVYCSPGYSVMYLIYAPDGPDGEFILPTPTSTGSPLKS